MIELTGQSKQRDGNLGRYGSLWLRNASPQSWHYRCPLQSSEQGVKIGGEIYLSGKGAVVQCFLEKTKLFPAPLNFGV